MARLEDMNVLDFFNMDEDADLYGVDEGSNIWRFERNSFQEIDDKECFKIWVNGFSQYPLRDKIFTTLEEAEQYAKGER